MANELHRLRVAYHKDGRLAYLGHLEVIATVERSIRRSGLPFSVGNGFAHRMRMQFSQALPVGASSREEYYDVMLTETVPAHEALERLVAATPSALGPLKAAYVQRKAPALEAWLTRSSWHIMVHGEGFDAQRLDRGIEAVRDEGVIHFMRGDKPRSIDLASTLVGWTATDEGGVVSLDLETRSSNLGALRPAVLLDAVFCEDCMEGAMRTATQVVRTAQAHEEGARLVNPFDNDLLLTLT